MGEWVGGWVNIDVHGIIILKRALNK